MQVITPFQNPSAFEYAMGGGVGRGPKAGRSAGQVLGGQEHLEGGNEERRTEAIL